MKRALIIILAASQLFMGIAVRADEGDETDLTSTVTEAPSGEEQDGGEEAETTPADTPSVTPADEVTSGEEEDAEPTVTPAEEQQEQLTDIEGFVTRLYQVTLGRAPDADGLAGWSEVLRSGRETGAVVARGFIFSDEFQGKDLTNEQYVDCMYRAFMGRDPDPDGLEGWVRVLDMMGRTEGREDVFAGFANSVEFQRICESYGIIRGYYEASGNSAQISQVNLFVERLYQVILGRHSDEEGMRGWTRALISHSNNGIEAASGFVFSSEYTGRHKSDSEYIDDLYMAFLGREADPAGKQGWLDRLAQGDSRRVVFNGFACSDEFSLICQNYGIVRGDALPVTLISRGGQNTWAEAMQRRGLTVPSGWVRDFVTQAEYWLAADPAIVYRMGGKSLESGYIDCSGFVTQLIRRSLGTMAREGSFASDMNDARNFSGYQDMTNRGVWNDNRGGARPSAEGVYTISSARSYRFYVDRYGIGSPNLMDVSDWFDYLMENKVEYTCANVMQASVYNEWDFLAGYNAGDIVIWSGNNGGFSSAGDVHIAVYDGEGGVYQSSGNTGGLSHIPIGSVLMDPTAAPSRKIYIFRMS